MTGRLLMVLLCASVLLSVPTYTRAQEFVPVEVEISKDKVNIKGEIFHVHKVLKGHTLYSISKAYGVDIAKLQEVNPSLLTEGLKAGSIIYIPVVADSGANSAQATAQQNTSVTADTKAEVQESNRQEAQKPQNKKYTKYKAKWYEGLQDIAVKFNVSVEALCALNGIDPSNTRRIRSILIPDEEYMRSFAAEEATSGSGEDAGHGGEVTDGNGTDIASLPAIEATGRMYDNGIYPISIVLPFNAADSATNANVHTADFYAGCLLAVNDLKKAGLFEHFVLNVVDTDKYGSSWSLLADRVLDGSELIIGPINERQLQPIANFGRHHKIPVVSPLDLSTKILAEDNPYFFLFPPQADITLAHQLDKIQKASTGAGLPDSATTVTVIYEKGYAESALVTETKTGLDNRGIRYTVFEYGFLEGRGIDSLLRASLNPAYHNKVIIPSVNEAFVSDALRNLSLIESQGKYSVDVYGMSKWKSFETLEPAYLHSLDLRLAISYNIDYNAPETIEFIAKYKKAFNTVPSSFAFQGYDIMTFFVNAMNEYGKDFPIKVINERKSLLQSDVLFLPVNYGSGYENRALKDIVYTKGWQVMVE